MKREETETKTFDLETAWACDFETTTEVDFKEEGCVRVYLWHARSLDDSDREAHGFDIGSFIDWLAVSKGVVRMCVFHNLRFDGSFILDYCLRSGWRYGGPNTRGTRKQPTRVVDTLITDLGQWMSMALKFGTHVVRFMDSVKKFPGLSLQQLADVYGIEGKSELNTYIRRPLGTPVTDEEMRRVEGDTRILRVAMRDVLGSGATKLTMASDAKQSFTEMWNGRWGRLNAVMWNAYFPRIPKELSKIFRKAYNAGWVYLNPSFKGVLLGGKGKDRIHVFDVNSMFPSKMILRMPRGLPQHRRPREGEGFITRFVASFRLKEGKLPFLHVKKSMYAMNSEFIIESDGLTELVMNDVDYRLFHECYEVDCEVNHEYWCFEMGESPFIEYIEYWMERKKSARSPEEKAAAKRYLNSLYGKTAENAEKKSKIPWFDEDEGKVRFRVEGSEGKEWYTPVAIWITSYARSEIVHFAEKFGDRFIYSDTDSVHVLGDEIPEGMPVDPKEIGKWKHESVSYQAVYVGPKKYTHYLTWDPADPSKKEVFTCACAGMPSGCKENVNLWNFRSGTRFEGKLQGKTVPGGYLLQEVEYTIRV